MSSLGESEVMIQSHTCGKVRLLNVFPERAVYPCLGLSIGFALLDQSKPFNGAEKALGRLELRGLAGELRLAQGESLVGRVSWSGPHHSVRSNDFGGEVQLRLSCDLDPARLEAIEEHRAGKPLVLLLALWPTLVAQVGVLDTYLKPIRAEVPSNQWLAFLGQVRGVSYDVLEIPIPALAQERLARSLDLVREARRAVDAGNYSDALSSCRKAVESLAQRFPAEPDKDALEMFFKSATHEKPAKEDRGVVTRVKQLAAYALHEMGGDVEYSRGEVLFVIRMTESLIGLVASLMQGRPV